MQLHAWPGCRCFLGACVSIRCRSLLLKHEDGLHSTPSYHQSFRWCLAKVAKKKRDHCLFVVCVLWFGCHVAVCNQHLPFPFRPQPGRVLPKEEPLTLFGRSPVGYSPRRNRLRGDHCRYVVKLLLLFLLLLLLLKYKFKKLHHSHTSPDCTASTMWDYLHGRKSRES